MSLNQQAKREARALPGAIKGEAWASIVKIVDEKYDPKKFESAAICVDELSKFREQHFGDSDSQFLLKNQLDAQRARGDELYEHMMICRAALAQIFVYEWASEKFGVDNGSLDLPDDAVEVLEKKGVKKPAGQGYLVKELIDALPELNGENSLGFYVTDDATLAKEHLRIKNLKK